jgi:hypothetical protein
MTSVDRGEVRIRAAEAGFTFRGFFAGRRQFSTCIAWRLQCILRRFPGGACGLAGNRCGAAA